MPATNFPSDIIVVTGAGGMIGSHILSELSARGCRLVACDHATRRERAAYNEGLALEEWLSPEALLPWLDQHAAKVAAVVHMGAISDTTERRWELLYDNNVLYTLALWQRARREGWRFLYASSASTYGAGELGFDDNGGYDYLEKLAPLNDYGRSKHLTDRKIFRDCLEGLPSPPVWAGFKFFNVYGSNEEHKGAMRSLVRKILPSIRKGEPVRLFRSHRDGYADGAQLRDFIYVKDAIRPVLLSLEKDDLSGLFNVGTGTPRTFLDLAHATFAAVGLEPKIEFIDMPKEIRDQYQYFTRANTRRSVEHGLQDIRFTLEQGVSDYVHWLDTGSQRIDDDGA